MIILKEIGKLFQCNSVVVNYINYIYIYIRFIINYLAVELKKVLGSTSQY